jgi:hypothetical protein
MPRGPVFQEPKTFKLQYSDNNSTWSDAFGLISPLFSAFGMGFAVDTPAAGFYVNWRVNVTAAQSGATATTAAEIGFHTTIGGSSASSGGTGWGDSTVNTPSNSFDGNVATFGYTQALPGYIAYAMPFPKNIVEVSWTLRNDSGPQQYPIAGTIDGSNDGGITWTTVATFSGLSWSTLGQTQVIATVSATAPPRHQLLD